MYVLNLKFKFNDNMILLSWHTKHDSGEKRAVVLYTSIFYDTAIKVKYFIVSITVG